MKKQLFALLLIAALLLQGAMAQTIRPGAAVQVSLLNQDPDPAQPGDTVEVRFKLENIGSTAQENVALEILTEYPFTILDEPVKEVGTLSASQVSTEGVTVKYRLLVAANAANGEYPVDVRFRAGEGWVRVENFMISIKHGEADLVLNSIDISPQIVAPGQAANLTMIVENQGSERVQQVKIKLDLTGSSLPFAPFGSSNEYTIGDMPAKSVRPVTFRIISNPEATADLYKLPIVLTFNNQQGQTINKSTITGVRIGSTPDLLTIIDKSDVTKKTGVGTVSVKIINKGLTDLRFVVVRLKPSDSFDVLSSQEVYLGKLESDDFETAEFKITAKKATGNTVSLPLEIEYRDASNQAYTETRTLSLHLLSDQEAQQLGLVQGGNMLWLVIVVVIAGIAVWWFFLRGKKRK